MERQKGKKLRGQKRTNEIVWKINDRKNFTLSGESEGRRAKPSTNYFYKVNLNIQTTNKLEYSEFENLTQTFIRKH
jgi:hypothetical protein